MSVRALPAHLLLALVIACGAATPAAPAPSPSPSSALTPTPTPAATPTPLPVRDEVLLDLTGTGSLPESRAFTIRGMSVNICWRLPVTSDARPAELTVRVHDAMTREERAVVTSDGAPAGCRAAPIRTPGRPYYLAISIAAGAAWHVAVVGQ